MAATSHIYIGIKGAVLALDAATGEIVWTAQLKGGDFVNVAVLDGRLYAAARGELFCLDPATGAVRWKNPLKGYGLGLISIASPTGSQAVLMREKQRLDEENAAATTSAT